MINDNFLRDRLADRIKNGNLRTLPTASSGQDFVSNDYLGLASNDVLLAQIEKRWSELPVKQLGGTGSRLLSGNHSLYDELEAQLREVFQSEAVLVFNSGYQANQALISSIAGRGDRMLYDELSHVCIKEGAWLSKAETFSFKHNDLSDLERRLKQNTASRTFILTETLFSMDGDFAPIQDMLELCDQFDAYLIVDEAHTTGAYGPRGGGWLMEHDLSDRVFARVYTFGKAMGAHGACIAGSQVLVDYMVNFARSFIYTTALPPHAVLSLIEAFKYLKSNLYLQSEFQAVIQFYRTTFHQLLGFESTSLSAIQPVWITGSEEAIQVSEHLTKHGFNALAIRPPTVKAGTERLRLSLHTFNSKDAIRELLMCLREVV